MREWTHVDDHSSAVHAILRTGRIGETYLIGSGEESTNADIMTTVLGLMGQPIDAFDHVPDRPGHDLHYANDTTKLRTELGWRPRYDDLRAGLATTIEWYREDEWWWKLLKGVAEAWYRMLGR